MSDLDLSMPQRQTYPAIRGSVSDEVGLLPLADADELSLLLQVDEAGDLFELTAVAIDPPEAFMLDGEEVMANFEAPIGASGLSADVAVYEGKLMITWDSGASPPLVQFAPQEDFIKVGVTRNVKAPT